MQPSSVLWLDAQPSLYCFNRRLARLLSESRTVRQWSFQHDLDESCSVETIHNLLVESLNDLDEPPHLIAHGLSGSIACLFAQRYPNLIRSLTVLSVDTQSCNHWTNHYLTMRSQLPCSRSQILSHLASALLKTDHVHVNSALSQLLEKCLDSDFISGSVVGQQSIDSLTPPDVPMLILNGEYDFVVDSGSLHRWRSVLKSGDYVDLIPQGRHFFQFSHAALVVEKINAFLDLIVTNEFPDTISSLSPVSSTLQS